MFAAPKHIAHKMVIKCKYVSQNTFINFYKSQFKTSQAKNSENDKNGKIAPIWAQELLLKLTFPATSPV